METAGFVRQAHSGNKPAEEDTSLGAKALGAAGLRTSPRTSQRCPAPTDPTQHTVDLLLAPDVEPALALLSTGGVKAVGIFCRVEAAPGVPHVSQEVVQGAAGHLRVVVPGVRSGSGVQSAGVRMPLGMQRRERCRPTCIFICQGSGFTQQGTADPSAQQRG